MMTSKLAHYRRSKGLSQQQLADISGVSARTIQRIESGKVEAHPATLKMLADTLEIDTQELSVQKQLSEAPEKGNGDMVKPLFHMLALIGLFFPVFNIVLPGLFWFFKKDESRIYDLEGKLVINFQITMSLLLIPSVLLMIFVFSVGFPLTVIIYFYNLIMCLFNIFRSINKRACFYPLTYQFLK
ncbi:helix-turn-helix domain-containing protein [Chryseobacterium cheonjiense]|uniref:Helix-turn-helix domain-containing protein n=1 Tax=Chryseobacterium cheonjiense TaxID=2728845 RepID=A0A7Y0A550_9FLAO|nr:helix-turn-helix domain-containing protein [Chryseobacterium cheonjiense]NML56839.1 helix-turn-helix domain-containing protein [Chryseobacterium cheonjiense]